MLDLGIPAPAEPLYLAASEGHSDVVEALADLVDDINAPVGRTGNALCAAACSERFSMSIKVVEILLQKGANVNWQGGHYGNALPGAAANYRWEIIQLLIKHDADVNAQGEHYGNALTAAARYRTHFLEMTELFLRHDADIDAQGPGVYGNPLQTAFWWGMSKASSSSCSMVLAKPFPGNSGRPWK